MKRKLKKHSIVYLVLIVVIIVLVALVGINGKKKEYKNAYDFFLESSGYKDDFSFPGDVRYEFAYIDEDDVPELLLADGDLHASRIGVYTYNKELKQVKFLASFSSFGKLAYVPKENTVISQYGNYGYYYIVYSKIENGKIELEDIILSDGSKNESKYYAGFPVDENFTGGYGKPNSEAGIFETLPEVTEEYRISEEEYEQLREKLEKGSIRIGYDEMQVIESKEYFSD